MVEVLNDPKAAKESTKVKPLETTMPKSPGKKKKAEREVKYPKVTLGMTFGEDAITVELAKNILGWEEADDDAEDYLLEDFYGKKIRCTNNVTNRPLYKTSLDSLVQEILQNRWQLNGEPVIVGKTGLVLNGQHALISLILAEQERIADVVSEAPHWKEFHLAPLTLEKLIVYGIDESDDTVNTMDTCKPRTLADVVYRSEFFKSSTGADRLQAAKMTESAMKMLWKRTGAVNDPFAPRRTHAEALDWIARHKKILECVKHIQKTDVTEELSLKELCPLGSASAILFLMGCGASDGDAYRSADPPSQRKLDWRLWDQAVSFWERLANPEDKEFKVLRQALGDLEKSEELGRASFPEIASVIAVGWEAFVEGTKFAKVDFSLPVITKDDGTKKRGVLHRFGGIDLGHKGEVEVVPIPRPPLRTGAKKGTHKNPTSLKEEKAATQTDRQRKIEESREKLRAQAKTKAGQDPAKAARKKESRAMKNGEVALPDVSPDGEDEASE